MLRLSTREDIGDLLHTPKKMDSFVPALALCLAQRAAIYHEVPEISSFADLSLEEKLYYIDLALHALKFIAD